MDDRYLLSFSYDMLDIDVKDAIEIINDNRNLVAGIEFSYKVDAIYFDKVFEYAKECKKQKLKFQLHGDITGLEDNDYMKEYINKINDIRKIYGERLKVVLHSINTGEVNSSILETIKVFKNILNYIDINEYDLEISIENLNYSKGMKRLNLKDLRKVLETFDRLKLTYDIGHEIFDETEDLNIDEFYFERLTNIHLHVPIDGKDHYPIYEITKRADEALQLISKFIKNGYTGNIVLEYSTKYIEKDTAIDRLKEYIELIKVIK